jgi:hypothetical protein
MYTLFKPSEAGLNELDKFPEVPSMISAERAVKM